VFCTNEAMRGQAQNELQTRCRERLLGVSLLDVEYQRCNKRAGRNVMKSHAGKGSWGSACWVFCTNEASRDQAQILQRIRCGEKVLGFSLLGVLCQQSNHQQSIERSGTIEMRNPLQGGGLGG
jgi:hypothetical protein